MKNLIKKYKINLIFFIFFLCLTAASGLYVIYHPPNKINLKSIDNISPSLPTLVEKPTVDTNNQKVKKNDNKSQPNNDISIKQLVEPSKSIKPDTSSSTLYKTENKTEITGGLQQLFINDEKYEKYLPADSTVYDLMVALKNNGQINFSGKNSAGLGFFVEEINGIKNNPSKNTYWFYYINGQKANVGISNYILKSGDVIKWQYENF